MGDFIESAADFIGKHIAWIAFAAGCSIGYEILNVFTTTLRGGALGIVALIIFCGPGFALVGLWWLMERYSGN